MAPPRETHAAAGEAKEHTTTSNTRSGTGSRSRKNAGAANAAKAAAAEKAAATTAATETQQQLSQSVDWPNMPLPVLHDYRYAYNLNCPSSYTTQISQIHLSQGIGLRSPTAIAERRAKRLEARRKAESANQHNTRRISSHAPGSGHQQSHAPSQGSKREREFTNGNGIRRHNSANLQNLSFVPPAYKIQRILAPESPRPPVAQGRVSKDQLASSVRRHFGSCNLVEQDAIARFIYKVREERRGREFRIKFQP